jgi:hypothetical protein
LKHILGTSSDHGESSPKAKDLVTLVAKQLDHLGQSNSLESVGSEMQSPPYQNQEMRHLAAARLSEEHLPISMTTTTTTTTTNNNKV